MEKSRKPKIRFKGYNDDWEQRKLGEVANYRRGSFPQPYGNSEWYDGEGAMPFVQVADVTDNMNLVEDTKQKISKLAQPMSVYAEKDSVLVTLQGSIGRVAIAQYGAFVDRTVLIFEKYKEKIDYSFWAYIVKQKFIEESRKAPGGTIKTITKEALSDFDLYIPQYQAQRRIAEFFKNIDILITLHQRKLDKLINVKKSMLEKMFPKQGSTVPEIRFNGFTQAWEQRKLGELVQFSKGNGYSKKDLEEVGTPIILYGRLYTNYETVISDVDTYVCAKSGSVYSRGGEVIVPASGETSEDISIASVVEKPGFLLGGDLNIITPPIQLDSVFLAISISNGKPHNDMAKMAQGKSVVHLHNFDLEKIDLLFPEHDEQARISSCIRGIDYLITLHQRLNASYLGI